MANMSIEGQRTKTWDDESDATLKRMAAEGGSASDIGKALNRSRNSICGRAWRLGINLHGASKPAGKVRMVSKGGRAPAPRVAKRRLMPRTPKEVFDKPVFNGNAFEVLPEGFTCQPVTLEELEDGRCKWPVGSLYCGSQAMPRKPYCMQHTYVSKLAPPTRVAEAPANKYDARRSLRFARDGW